MRVLVITPWFPTRKKPGSGAFMLRDVELLEANHAVTVIHLASVGDLGADEPIREVLDSGTTVIRQRFISSSPTSLLRARTTIRRHLERSDLVHTMALHALLPTRLARPRIPWVHTEHWSGLMRESLSLKKRAGLAFSQSSLSHPSLVVAVSDVLADAVRGHTRQAVRVIPNHVQLGPLDLRPERLELRGDGPLKLVAVGNLIHHKGPMFAVESLRELRDRGTLATLTWVGTGPLREQLVARAGELGVDDALSLVGQLKPDEIPAALRQAHIFMLPTVSETFGVALAEALGQGLPVVTTGHGGHLSFLPPAASRVARERTGRALADAVESLIRDQKRWTGGQIVKYAHECFSERSRQSAYASVYDSVARI